MLQNPFCFLVQVFGILVAVWPLHSISASDGFFGRNLGDSVIGVSADGDVCVISDNTMHFDFVSALAPSTVTSHHMGLPSALKRVAPQDSFSGLGSSASETMLQNPFCFLVQVFGTLVAVWPLHSISASDGFFGRNLGDSVIGVSADGDVCVISDNTMPFDLVSAFAPSTVTSHHMGLPSALKRVAPQDSLSGLGSSASETMLQNPFCVLVQVFGTLVAVWPLHSISASDGFFGRNLGDSVIGVSADGDVCVISDNTMPFDLVSALAPSTVTSHHMGLPSALKRVAPQDSFSGLGSSASETMLQNPFCVLVQVFGTLVAVWPLHSISASDDFLVAISVTASSGFQRMVMSA
ncbi:hypothetical protein MTO96_012608 [Rhipicephalus appendiculatus]